MASVLNEKARLIFIGGESLADGFRLIGFETLIDPDAASIDRVISELLEDKSNAYMVVEQQPEYMSATLMRQILGEGGRIVVAQVPPLSNPDGYHTKLDELIPRMMNGASETTKLSQ